MRVNQSLYKVMVFFNLKLCINGLFQISEVIFLGLIRVWLAIKKLVIKFTIFDQLISTSRFRRMLSILNSVKMYHDRKLMSC